MFSKRDALTQLLLAPFGCVTPRSVSQNTVVRGMAVGMKTAIQGFEAGTSWSRVTRTAHRSAVGFARSRVVIATFAIGPGRPLADTDFTHSYHFAVVLEPRYQDARTGLTAKQRLQYLFYGSRIAAYDGPGTNPFGFIVSDWLYHPHVSRGQKFGLLTTVENQRRTDSGPQTLPFIDNSSSYIERYEGQLTNQIGGRHPAVSFIDTNAAMTDTSFLNFSTAIGGAAGGFTPSMMLIDYARETTVPAIFGDSIAYGVGEGAAGSSGYGDALGSAQRNAGYPARGINDRLGLNYALNLSKGSDGYKYTGRPGAINKRVQLLALANPTHVFAENIHNDISGGASAAETKMRMRATLDAIRASVPSAKLVQGTCTPDSASTVGRWAAKDASDQTPRPGWGDGKSPRGLQNARIRAKDPSLGRIDAVFDPNIVAEFGWASGRETGLWWSPGYSFGPVPDGTHPNSFMSQRIASSMSARLFA